MVCLVSVETRYIAINESIVVIIVCLLSGESEICHHKLIKSNDNSII